MEGDSGLGKSTLLKALLEEQGLRSKATNTTQKYYEISAGNADSHDILLKAFHEGAVVILDELNLDESLETLLNQLLTGYDMNGNKAKQPGFYVLASQNPGHFAGRKSISSALNNRFHHIYMDDYSTEELTSIASCYEIDNPQAFTAAYAKIVKEKPGANTRTFFTQLGRYQKKIDNRQKNTVVNKIHF